MSTFGRNKGGGSRRPLFLFLPPPQISQKKPKIRGQGMNGSFYYRLHCMEEEKSCVILGV